MSINHGVRPAFEPDSDPDDVSSNTSNNTPFREILAARMSRRRVVRGGTVVAAGFLAGSGIGLGEAAPSAAHGSRRKLLGFTPVAPSQADDVIVPDGYTAEVLIPWGTPIRPGGPAWRKDASNTAAEQEQQVGMHHDANCYFPIGRGSAGNRRGLLVTNHEYTDNTILYPDGNAVLTQEKVNKALAARRTAGGTRPTCCCARARPPTPWGPRRSTVQSGLPSTRTTRTCTCR